MFLKVSVLSLILSLIVLDSYTMQNKNTPKVLPVKITPEQADRIFTHGTKEERGFIYVDWNGEHFIEVTRESILAYELKKKQFLKNHSDRL